MSRGLRFEFCENAFGKDIKTFWLVQGFQRIEMHDIQTRRRTELDGTGKVRGIVKTEIETDVDCEKYH